jgi:hypothetical protein
MNKITASTVRAGAVTSATRPIWPGSVLDHRTAGGSHHEQETTEQFTE